MQPAKGSIARASTCFRHTCFQYGFPRVIVHGLIWTGNGVMVTMRTYSKWLAIVYSMLTSKGPVQDTSLTSKRCHTNLSAMYHEAGTRVKVHGNGLGKGQRALLRELGRDFLEGEHLRWI